MSNQQNRIAILSVHSSPLGQPGVGDTGGMSIYIRELTLELVKLGHAVDIFTRSQDSSTPQIINLAPNARLIHIQAGEQSDLDKLLIYSHVPDFACKTENFRKQFNLQYDLIFSHYWLSGIAGQYLQTWWQVPQMMMFHTLGAVKNAIGIGEDESDLRLDEEKQSAQYCQRIIASTEKEKIALNHFYNIPLDKIRVIPCGVNLDLFTPLNKPAARRCLNLTSDKIILFVGRVERLKGIDSIVQALPYLSDIKPALIVVGEDGNRPGEIEKLKIMAKNLGVLDSVIFTGLVDYEKLPFYYSAADVCVFPSHYESFGLVPLEALACGVPVIASDVGDLKNIIRQGETGYILPDRGRISFAEKIKEILNGSSSLVDAKAIRSSVTRFGWQNIACSINNEFFNLMNQNKVLTQK
jgi:D-inositol-3-phosphate glycosyltransferase